MPLARSRRPIVSRIRRLCALLIAAVAVLGLSACTHGDPALPPMPSPLAGRQPAGPGHPNIVFVLTDDLSSNLLPYMPHVQALADAGMSFTNYTVADSLCCPSRASIFTGDFPHDTHVLTNTPPVGGFTRFRNLGDYRSTFATSVYGAGYRTAFFGKYLNGYQPEASERTHALQSSRGAWVPPGWTTWGAVGGGGYSGYGYLMADGHAIDRYHHDPSDYMTTVLRQKAIQFIGRAAQHPNPFLLEVATFAPHKPYVPAPQDEQTFPGASQPEPPDYNRLPSPTPGWMRGRELLSPLEQRTIRRSWQLRVESVQSVDRMVGAIERELIATHRANDTVFVFSSDNGYHLGEHALEYGKQTAFDTDIQVPLIVAGPGIRAGSTNAAVVQNIDLRPTFDQLAGAATPANVDGRSLVPLLHGEHPPWRTVAFVEHHHPTPTPADPDVQTHRAGTPPSYVAIRTPQWVYVRYQHGDREYYDLVKDPYELHNLGPSLGAARVARLDAIADRLKNCHGGEACFAAGLPASG